MSRDVVNWINHNKIEIKTKPLHLSNYWTPLTGEVKDSSPISPPLPPESLNPSPMKKQVQSRLSSRKTISTKIAQLGDAARKADPTMHDGHFKMHIKNAADRPAI